MIALRVFILIFTMGYGFHVNSVDKWPCDPLLKRALTTIDEDLFLKSRPIVISLGQDCQVALNLMYSKLRFMAYPFDWVVTPFDVMCDMIKTDFAHCKSRDCFINTNDPRFNNYHITNMYYPNFLLPHAKWETVFEDFNRRIDRFYKALRYGENFQKNIFFILYSNSFTDVFVKDKAFQLRNLLVEKFPQLRFNIVTMHHAIALGSFTEDNCVFYHLDHEGWTQESYKEWGLALASIIKEDSCVDGVFYDDHPFKNKAKA